MVCEIDLRVGGDWRYVVRAPDGSEMVLRGTYTEITPPARLVHTEVNEDCWAAAGVDTIITYRTWTERAGQDPADHNELVSVNREPGQRAEIRNGTRGWPGLQQARRSPRIHLAREVSA